VLGVVEGSGDSRQDWPMKSLDGESCSGKCERRTHT